MNTSTKWNTKAFSYSTCIMIAKMSRDAYATYLAFHEEAVRNWDGLENKQQTALMRTVNGALNHPDQTEEQIYENHLYQQVFEDPKGDQDLEMIKFDELRHSQRYLYTLIRVLTTSYIVKAAPLGYDGG